MNWLLNTLHKTPLRHRRTTSAIAIACATLAVSSCGSDESSTTGPALSSDATLSALQLDTGTLTPAFASATISYTASVPNGTAFEIIRPSASNSAATITVNGAKVASGAASPGTALTVGSNTISVIVTAEDQQTTKAYTIVVNRAAVGGTT